MMKKYSLLAQKWNNCSSWNLQKILFAVTLFVVFTCDCNILADISGCYYNFQHYEEGDQIVTNEPCLNCTCRSAMLMCYLKVCPYIKDIDHDCTVEKSVDQCCPIITCPKVSMKLLSSSTTVPTTSSIQTAVAYRDGCTMQDNTHYENGAMVPSNSKEPCELCYCIHNYTACVMQECTLHIEGCKAVYQEGVCCPVRYDCDYTEEYTKLTDMLNGDLLISSASTPDVSDNCHYGGLTYSDGELIITEKPCEHCYCMRSDIVCAIEDCGQPLHGNGCIPTVPPVDQCCPTSYSCGVTDPIKTNTNNSTTLINLSDSLLDQKSNISNVVYFDSLQHLSTIIKYEQDAITSTPSYFTESNGILFNDEANIAANKNQDGNSSLSDHHSTVVNTENIRERNTDKNEYNTNTERISDYNTTQNEYNTHKSANISDSTTRESIHTESIIYTTAKDILSATLLDYSLVENQSYNETSQHSNASSVWTQNTTKNIVTDSINEIIKISVTSQMDINLSDSTIADMTTVKQIPSHYDESTDARNETTTTLESSTTFLDTAHPTYPKIPAVGDELVKNTNAPPLLPSDLVALNDIFQSDNDKLNEPILQLELFTTIQPSTFIFQSNLNDHMQFENKIASITTIEATDKTESLLMEHTVPITEQLQNHTFPDAVASSTISSGTTNYTVLQRHPNTEITATDTYYRETPLPERISIYDFTTKLNANYINTESTHTTNESHMYSNENKTIESGTTWKNPMRVDFSTPDFEVTTVLFNELFLDNFHDKAALSNDTSSVPSPEIDSLNFTKLASSSEPITEQISTAGKLSSPILALSDKTSSQTDNISSTEGSNQHNTDSWNNTSWTSVITTDTKKTSERVSASSTAEMSSKFKQPYTTEPIYPFNYTSMDKFSSNNDEYNDIFGPGTCKYGGKIYATAQQIPRGNPCDFCFCFRSDIICLQQSCPPPITGCQQEIIDGFCCPRFECPLLINSTPTTTTITTTTTAATVLPFFFPDVYRNAGKRAGCLIRGNFYRTGDDIPAFSGPCLECICGSKGRMKCEPKSCSPEALMRNVARHR